MIVLNSWGVQFKGKSILLLISNYAIDDFVKKNSVDWTYFGIVVREDPMQEWY